MTHFLTWVTLAGALWAAQPAMAQSLDRGLEQIAPTNLGVQKYHAVLIAEYDYADDSGLRDLVSPSTDVTRIATLLRDQYGFTTEVLENRGRDAIISKLDSLRDPRVIGPDDVLILYYAGHGILDADEGRGYWLPADAMAASTATWISTDDVSAKVRAMRARHVLVIADACFSAALVRSLPPSTAVMRSGPPRLTESVARRVVAKKSRRVLSSGGLEAVSDIGTHGMSPFAYSLFHLLQDSRDPYVNPAQLATALLGSVGKAGQTPVFGTLAGTEGLADPGYPILINQRGIHDTPSPVQATPPLVTTPTVTGTPVQAATLPSSPRNDSGRQVLRGVSIGLGVVGGVALLASVPLAKEANDAFDEGDPLYPSLLNMQRASVVTGWSTLGLGALLLTTTFVIK